MTGVQTCALPILAARKGKFPNNFHRRWDLDTLILRSEEQKKNSRSPIVVGLRLGEAGDKSNSTFVSFLQDLNALFSMCLDRVSRLTTY